MKVATLSNHTDCIQIIEGQLQSEVTRLSSFDELDKLKCDALLVDQEFVDFSSLIDFRDVQPSIKTILLVDSPLNETQKRICNAQRIVPFYKENSRDEFKQLILQEWLEHIVKQNQNVISISGTHSQSGVTQTALSLGVALRELNYKVCVIGLNFYNPGEIIGFPSEFSFDSLYHSVSNHLFDAEGLKKQLIEIHGIQYLVGNRNFLKKNKYHPEPIHSLINIVKEEYDFVILDLGSIYDTSGALAGIMASGTKILVANQDEYSIRNFNRWFDQFLSPIGIQKEDLLMVVNRFDPIHLIKPKKIEEEMGVTLFEKIPLIPVDGSDGVLYNYYVKSYNRTFNRMAKGITTLPTEKKKKSFFSFAR
ncbi:hypothetical protein [Cytobacillus oceanisediminis]|uniref:AAA domain-containing protein n=1 Tax=Cytobacillus oceanisediminis TaxID=665099 RepID=A0ABX3CJX4_9BACI|nr:hypothetical protein [Cytobacillus oceanisediminis]OHX41368.1 hypothetical protein BBV17_28640 [Cytobacillus oceanisediminis]